jgi:lysophospholipase L1-like esterase
MKPNQTYVINNNVDIINKRIQIDANSSRRIPCGTNINAYKPKIYLIGDSQTFGWGLSDEETWANHLQCGIVNNEKNQFKVINLGVPGIQVDQYLARGLAQVLPSIIPGDAVVISITWNDLIDFYKNDKWVKKQIWKAGLTQSPSDKNKLIVTHALNFKTTNDSVFKYTSKPIEFKSDKPYTVLNPKTWRYYFYQKYGVFIPSIGSFSALNQSLQFISAFYRVIEPSARLLFYRIRPAQSLFEKIPHNSFEKNFLSLKVLSHKLESQGAKVLIQLLPNRLFYDDYYYNSYSKNGVVFPDRNYMHYIATPFCKSLNLKCVDRFSDLQTSTTNAYNLPYDGHYNASAAALIGAAITRDIKKLFQIEN